MKNKSNIIKIYTTPTCAYCQMAKAYFKSKNIEYEEYNVAADRAKAEEMVAISGQMGVPVIIIGKGLIIGFDKAAIDQALKEEDLHQCKECGFHYADKELAEKCEAWCKEHKSCNLEITSQAEENKTPQ